MPDDISATVNEAVSETASIWQALGSSIPVEKILAAVLVLALCLLAWR